MKLFSIKSRFPRAHVCNVLCTAAALVRTSLSLSGQHIFAVQISWSWNAIFLRRRRFCAHAQEAEPHRRRGPAWAGHVGVSDYPSYKNGRKAEPIFSFSSSPYTSSCFFSFFFFFCPSFLFCFRSWFLLSKFPRPATVQLCPPKVAEKGPHPSSSLHDHAHHWCPLSFYQSRRFK